MTKEYSWKTRNSRGLLRGRSKIKKISIRKARVVWKLQQVKIIIRMNKKLCYKGLFISN